MVWTIIGVLILMWLLGFSLEIAGNFVHILLVVVLVLAVIRMLPGRRA